MCVYTIRYGMTENIGGAHLSDKSKASSFRLRSSSLNSLRLRRIFDLFDKNGDEMLSVEELSQALNLLGLENEVAELDSVIRSFIRKGNKGLEFEDFEALHQSLSESLFGDMDEAAMEAANQEESDLREAFKVFDLDGDGHISAQELQTVLIKLGFNESGEIDSVRQMINSYDRNNDGEVDFSEFRDMMRGGGLVRPS